jgi:transcription initiation factor IIF auxiliary subunit
MQRKKNYLLFLMGDFKSINKPLGHLIDTLSFVIGSPYLKYVHHDNLIIAHFESNDNLEDIHYFLNTTLDESILSYFLFPKPRKMGIRLDEELEKHLKDLKKNTLNKSDMFSEKVNDNLLHINDVLQDYTNKFINKVKKESEKKEYNLDDILDKITQSGMDSLTTEEKKFLESIN